MRSKISRATYQTIVEDLENARRKICSLQAEIQQLNEQLFAKIQACDALPLIHAKEEEIGQKQIVINKQANQIQKLQAALLKERFWAIWRKGKHTDVNVATELAKKQLRAEMPEEMT